MYARESEARVFVDGRHVANAVVIERVNPSRARFPMPGRNIYGYKDTTTRGPSTLVLTNLSDAAFEAAVRKLMAAARDDAEKRRQRESGERSVSVALGLDDGRQIMGAQIDWPLVGYGPIEEVEFPVHAAEL